MGKFLCFLSLRPHILCGPWDESLGLPHPSFYITITNSSTQNAFLPCLGYIGYFYLDLLCLQLSLWRFSIPLKTLEECSKSFSAVTTGRHTRKKITSMIELIKQYFVKGFSVIVLYHLKFNFPGTLWVSPRTHLVVFLLEISLPNSLLWHWYSPPPPLFMWALCSGSGHWRGRIIVSAQGVIVAHKT